MPADNAIYETLDDWWDPTGSVAGLHAMNPARAAYFLDTLDGVLPSSLRARPVLDLGCGGGLLAAPLAEAGLDVVGIDRAEAALRCTRDHARHAGLAPRVVRAAAEALPFRNGCFGAVVCADVLEHLGDRDVVIGEAARVLAEGGLFLYDTINRTWLTLLVHIGLVQRWRRLVPADTHAWSQFVRPRELRRSLRRAGLVPVETKGLVPERPVRFALRLLVHRKGRDRMPPFRIARWTAGSYVGYAVKDSLGPGAQ